MKTSVFVFLLVLVSPLVCAQKFSAPFGEIPESEMREALTMTDYPAEPGTPALGLHRSLKIETGTYGTKLTSLIRTKIFSSSAFDEWGNEKTLSHANGITTIKAYTYNLVGDQIIKRALAETDIRVRKLNRSWNEYSLAMPNIREGCVVEIQIVTMMKYFWLPGLTFQIGIPCLYSELYLDSPLGGFRADVSGKIAVRYQELKKKQTHRWSAVNIPSFIKEPYMPNSDLYQSAVHLWVYEQPWPSNDDLIAWRKNFFVMTSGQLSGVKEKAKQLTAGLSDDRSKIKAIVEHVKQTVSYNGIEDAVAYDYNDIIKEKKGSAADINLLLTAILMHADIQANPVLLRTRDNGHHHENIPTLSQFNYAIAQAVVGKDTLYLDATEQDLQYNALPTRCLNDRGLLITKNSAHWVNITATQKRKLTAEGNLTILSSGELKGKFSVIRDGYEAADSRQSLRELGDNYFKEQIPNTWMMSNPAIQNDKINELPLVENYEIEIADGASLINDKIYINPYLMPYVNSNPFTSDQRFYPVDFVSPLEATLLCNLTIPEGFVVEELPQSKVMALPQNASRAIFNISSTGRQIQIMTRLQINRTFYLPEEYDQLKEFFTRLIAKQGEQIVLKKI